MAKLVSLPLLFFMALTNVAIAEPLTFTISNQAHTIFRNTLYMKIVQESLELAGHDIDIQVQPGERGLRMAANGESDGELFRQPQAVLGIPQLLRVDVPIGQFKHHVLISKKKECPKDMKNIRQLKPIGISGLKYFDIIYSKSDVGYLQVNNYQQLVESLKKHRADYTVGPVKQFQTLDLQDGKLDLKPCLAEPVIVTNTYIYLNEQHRELKRGIEKSLRETKLKYPQ